VINHERAKSWIILYIEDKVEYHGKLIPAEKEKTLAYLRHVSHIINV